jgi:hypothetical protein
MIRDEIREERKKLKGAPFKKKVSYFLHYYFIWTVLVVAVVIAIVLLTRAFLNRKTNAFTAVFLNSEEKDANQGPTLEKRLEKKWSLSSREAVELDFTSTLHSGKNRDESDMGTITMLAADVREKSLDALVCDPQNFNDFASQSMFLDLRKVLSEEELGKLQGRICYIDQADSGQADSNQADSNQGDSNQENLDQGDSNQQNSLSTDPTEMKNPVPVGVILSDSSYFKEHSLYQKTLPVLGITNTGKHRSRSRELLLLLLK